MILACFLLALLSTVRCEATGSASDEEAPFVTSSRGDAPEGTASDLLPDLPEESPFVVSGAPSERGRSDVEVERDPPFAGYFYPKPSKPFHLPPFKALDASAPAVGQAAFAEDDEGVERQPRSPQRRRPYFQSPPPFIPGFIPPHNIRPLPALYGRPGGY